jgi:hypothetical protein
MKEPDIISDMKDLNQQQNIIVEKLKQQQHQQGNNSNGKGVTASAINNAMGIKPELPLLKLSPNVNVLKCNNQIKELHTVIRDK